MRTLYRTFPWFCELSGCWELLGESQSWRATVEGCCGKWWKERKTGPEWAGAVGVVIEILYHMPTVVQQGLRLAPAQLSTKVGVVR